MGLRAGRSRGISAASAGPSSATSLWKHHRRNSGPEGTSSRAAVLKTQPLDVHTGGSGASEGGVRSGFYEASIDLFICKQSRRERKNRTAASKRRISPILTSSHAALVVQNDLSARFFFNSALSLSTAGQGELNKLALVIKTGPWDLRSGTI